MSSCVAKHWRQRSGSHEGGFFPIPANHVIFRHLTVHATRFKSPGDS